MVWALQQHSVSSGDTVGQQKEAERPQLAVRIKTPKPSPFLGCPHLCLCARRLQPAGEPRSAW